MELTATEFINEALNFCWITFKTEIDFFGNIVYKYTKTLLYNSCTISK